MPFLRHVKVFDLVNYELVHTIDYPSAILSLGVLVCWVRIFVVFDFFKDYVLFRKLKPEDKSLIVGMSDGLLSIKDKRKPMSEKSANLNQEPFNMAYKSKKYNPYKYVSPSLVNSSPVSLFPNA